ncbi:hypothetical protein Esti_001001 [Eimeria stiedai]
MAVVSVTNIRVLNNPCPLNAPFLFEIHFEAQQALKHDVEWRVVYVGSGEHYGNSSAAAATAAKEGCMHADGAPQPVAAAGSSKLQTAACKKQPSRGADYVLDSVLLGPIERGALAFEFAVNAPDFTQMDPGSVEGMQAVLVCGLYKGKEFVRIGYYLNNAYSDSTLRENPPEVPLYDRLIEWDDEEEISPSPLPPPGAPPQQAQQGLKGAPRGPPPPAAPRPATAAEVCQTAPTG